MSENKRNHSMFGKGYYIALILCAAAIGITGYLYNRNESKQTDTPVQGNPTDSTLSAVVEQGDDIAVIATQPSKETEIPFQESTQPSQSQQGLKTTAPVSGETLMGYSMEALGYNQTTRDWRVHDGVDIGAEAGTKVCAAADGTVYTVYEDETMGMTVVIRHDGGYTTRYASLAEAVSVKAGDKVTAGQVIGCVGSTALLESAIGDHVHFSVSCDGKTVDPADFLA